MSFLVDVYHHKRNLGVITWYLGNSWHQLCQVVLNVYQWERGVFKRGNGWPPIFCIRSSRRPSCSPRVGNFAPIEAGGRGFFDMNNFPTNSKVLVQLLFPVRCASGQFYVLFGIWRARRLEGATKLRALLEVLKKSAIFLIFLVLLLFVFLFLVRVTGNADCSVWNETFFGKYFCWLSLICFNLGQSNIDSSTKYRLGMTWMSTDSRFLVLS